MNPQMKDSILSLIRHALTFAGGFIAAKYGVDGASIESIISGLVAVAAATWGVIEKAQRPKA
jgi:hypothetical protein